MDTLPASDQSSRDNGPKGPCQTCSHPEGFVVQVFAPGQIGIPEPTLLCRSCEVDASIIGGAVVARVLGPRASVPRIVQRLNDLDAALEHFDALIDSGVFRQGA